MNIEKGAPKLTQTSPEVFDLLKKQIGSLASRVNIGESIPAAVIERAAFTAALQAEKEGSPYTEENAGEIVAGSKEEQRLLDALAGRMSIQKQMQEPVPMRVADSYGNYIGTVSSKGEAENVIREERERGGNPQA